MFGEIVGITGVLLAVVSLWVAWRQSTDARNWRKGEEQRRAENDDRQRAAAVQAADRERRRKWHALYDEELNDARRAVNRIRDGADLAGSDDGPLTMDRMEQLDLLGSLRRIMQIAKDVPDSRLGQVLHRRQAGDPDLSKVVRAFAATALPGSKQMEVEGIVAAVRRTKEQMVSAQAALEAAERVRDAINQDLAE